jgi:glycosyltransferase involved in cell wall biosynthesis
MKVLHVIPSVSYQAGGPSQVIFPMCRSLGALGVDVLLATTDDGVSSSEFRVSGSQSRLPSGPADSVIREFRGVQTIYFPKQWGQSFKYSRPFSAWLNNNVAEYDLVHIHAVFNHACIAAARACRRQGVPYVVRPLGTLDPWSMKQKNWRKQLFWHGGVKTVLSSAAAVHYTAEAEQQGTEASLGLNHGVVIPLGVELPTGEPAPREMFGKLQELRRHPYVLVLSRLLPTKGIDVLLEAFLTLLKENDFDEWRLVLAGEGPPKYVAALRETVAAARADGLVLFPGWLDGAEKEAALRHASLLALPSYHENFGLCLIEALAYGVPVIVSPQVNLAPEIEASGAGWVAEIETGALLSALQAALNSDEELAQRGAAGLALARRYDWSVVAEKLKGLYSSILESKLHA